MATRRNVLPVIYPQRKKSHAGHLKLLAAVLFGMFMGRITCLRDGTPHYTSIHAVSSVQQLEDLPWRNTSHVNPKTGIAITKKQLLNPFVVQRQTGFSVATIHPGESVELHSHKNMHEFFYVLEGAAVFQVCGKSHETGPGTFVHVVPHCEHGIKVPKDSQSLKVLISGVTVDE